MFTIDNVVIDDPQIIVVILREYFLLKIARANCFLLPPDGKEINTLISLLKSSNTIDINSIPSKILKYSWSIISDAILHLVNSHFETGILPKN